MKRFLKLKNERGDTIVEVMIVLAILSLAFAVSYATANRGLSQSRNAEEHSQALGIMNSQVEQLRNAVSQQIPALMNLAAGTPFCMTSTSTISTDLSACQQNFYQPSIQAKDDDGSSGPKRPYYDVKIGWDGVGSLGRQQEEITYRIQKLDINANSGHDYDTTPSTINVAIKAISPGAASFSTPTTPLCSSTNARVNHDAPSVTLKQVGGTYTQANTTAGSTKTFTGMPADFNYTATIVPPAGFISCDPPLNTSAPVKATPGPHTITMEITPQCVTPRQETYNTYYGPDGGVGGPGWYVDGGVGGPGWYSDPPYQHPYGHYHPVYWWEHNPGNYLIYGGQQSPVYGSSNGPQFGYVAPAPGGAGWVAYEDVPTNPRKDGWYYNRFISNGPSWVYDGYFADGGVGGPGWYSDPPYQHPYQHAYQHTSTRIVYDCPT